MIFTSLWCHRFLSLFFLVGIVIIMGAGCKNTPANQNSSSISQNEEAFTQEDLPVFDSDVSSPSSSPNSTSQNESTSSRGPLRGRVQEVVAGRSILLLNEGCSLEDYKDQALQVYQEKDLGTSAVLVAEFEEGTTFEGDACVEMFFPVTDIASLKTLLQTLQLDLQNYLDETEVALTIQQDLPGTCEEVAAYIAEKHPKFADHALARCEQLQKQREDQGDDGNEDLQNENNNVSCSVIPENTCSPSMDSEGYVKYAQQFFTPGDSVVIAEAGNYGDIDSAYKAMQKRYWVSDTEIYGCDDKFATPSDYFSKSLYFTSSPVCEEKSAVGDCDDQASGGGSMYEAAAFFGTDNVRTALGMVQFGKSPLDIGGHAWTEVYYEGQWFPVDAVFGNTCYEDGKCYSYNDNELIDWDYFRYVEYPVVQYWGWSNDKWYYLPETGEGTSGMPSYWKEKSSTLYK